MTLPFQMYGQRDQLSPAELDAARIEQHFWESAIECCHTLGIQMMYQGRKYDGLASERMP